MNKKDIEHMMRGLISKGSVTADQPMSNYTSFKVGGPADLLIIPGDAKELSETVGACKRKGIEFYIIGNGTNLIVSDKGIRGVVIKICENFCAYSIEQNTVTAEAGMLLSRLSNIALQNGLTGMEFASGIPGTLGGAVSMNAGAYGGEMKDIIVETEYIDREGAFGTIKGEAHRFGYRTSLIQEMGCIVIRSAIKLERGDKACIKACMEDFARRRRDKQPLEMPSAGSIFKRPDGYFSGKLIEDCGLKGYSIGGAQVSPKHCGFIVNTGNAKASDVICLIERIKSEVSLRFGVNLQTEVKILGEQ